MSLLAGIRVLDLSLQLPGPFCTLMMADYGADVIKVDEPTPRARNPFSGGDPGMGAAERYLNRGKRSLTLDLKTQEGREIFRKLAAGWKALDHPGARGEPAANPRRAPRLGEHDEEILSGIGYDAVRIARLRESGVIRVQ